MGPEDGSFRGAAGEVVGGLEESAQGEVLLPVGDRGVRGVSHRLCSSLEGPAARQPTLIARARLVGWIR
jgi:hypothetical protein